MRIDCRYLIMRRSFIKFIDILKYLQDKSII